MDKTWTYMYVPNHWSLQSEKWPVNWKCPVAWSSQHPCFPSYVVAWSLLVDTEPAKKAKCPLIEQYKRYLSLRMIFHVAPEVQQYTGIAISGTSVFLGQPKHAFTHLRLRSKTYHFGNTLVEGQSDGTRGEPQNSPRVAPEVHTYNKIPAKPTFNQRPCWHFRNRVAHLFPIQFPVLYYSW